MTLSGLLNVIDGLWSNNGDGRIIVFTTNHKDQFEHVILHHVWFKQLASTYLDINGDHQLYGRIEPLFEKAEVAPAAIAEELPRTEDTDVALRGVVELLEEKTNELENAISI